MVQKAAKRFISKVIVCRGQFYVYDAGHFIYFSK
jgi:hypothetical protein